MPEGVGERSFRLRLKLPSHLSASVRAFLMRENASKVTLAKLNRGQKVLGLSFGGF
jgi:hypothetical protein